MYNTMKQILDEKRDKMNKLQFLPLWNFLITKETLFDI